MTRRLPCPGVGHDGVKPMRAARAEMLVQLDISLLFGKHWRERSWLLVIGTLRQLTDVNCRPPVPRDPIPQELLHHVPSTEFKLDTDKLSRNLRSSRRGAAGGPSGMTMEHLRSQRVGVVL